eukprot:TRINITY_DN34334_c0_g1_i1.p2 TRINITY_DN34334_c0_g1~~TRINITY_DN34334_c0_g1_i1.p2  ORF type:complete len:103 (+),score=15.14 TRINITY_DN34334_c0_g1_i1:259-567(+)
MRFYFWLAESSRGGGPLCCSKCSLSRFVLYSCKQLETDEGATELAPVAPTMLREPDIVGDTENIAVGIAEQLLAACFFRDFSVNSQSCGSHEPQWWCLSVRR